MVSKEDTIFALWGELGCTCCVLLGVIPTQEFGPKGNGKTAETLPEPVFSGDLSAIHSLGEIQGHRLVLCSQTPQLVQ